MITPAPSLQLTTAASALEEDLDGLPAQLAAQGSLRAREVAL